MGTFRVSDFQDAVGVGGLHLTRVDNRRQFEGAGQGSVAEFGAVSLFVFVLCFFFVPHGDLQLVAGHAARRGPGNETGGTGSEQEPVTTAQTRRPS